MKKHSVLNMAVSLFLRYLAASLLCLLVVVSLVTLFNQFWGRFICQLLMLILLTGVIYARSWEIGEKEANYISRGILKKDKWKGTKAGLLAVIPMVLFWILLLLSHLHIIADILASYKLMNPAFFHLIGAILPAVTAAENSLLNICIVPLLFLYIPLVSQIGYVLGVKRISITQKMIYKK